METFTITFDNSDMVDSIYFDYGIPLKRIPRKEKKELRKQCKSKFQLSKRKWAHLSIRMAIYKRTGNIF